MSEIVVMGDCPRMELARAVLAIPPGRRGAVMQTVVSFRPELPFIESIDVGALRATFAGCWWDRYSSVAPICPLRAVFEPPVPIKTVLEFSKLVVVQDLDEMFGSLTLLLDYLYRMVESQNRPNQLTLFEADGAARQRLSDSKPLAVGETVSDLNQLVSTGKKFSTVYADPPWEYDNSASRGAANNHYPTMSIDRICAEPVTDLVESDAHLHLWTTNAFLLESFEVMRAWGFKFKSCLVWVKSEIGMGNYWRNSHEYLMLGIRGNMTFRDRTLRSWIESSRTTHSRKPGIVRALIERVSPGPYLEMYGREELPNSAWTVYGNQVGRRLF